MLELKNIKKTYKIGETITKALDDISVAFRHSEFVAILGMSGSGKTTCLNVVGGLDRYDSGDMIINGKSTKSFREEDWDAYRNNSIGFIFQSYNLITHLGIIENVELGMTLSGVSAEVKHRKALEALEKVGLKEHLGKKPNQLSGGQMQRVAIARALVNDPDIILADEPTGALDTETSVQIMDLIREVAKDKLVIMVTHNPDLAKEYSDRIVEFRDGKIVNDTNPHIEKPKEDNFKLKKTSMSFFTALKLSANNIKTKKGRTALTAFASSIGIIGIGLILALSGGFQIQIDKFQTESLSNFPILITQTTIQADMGQMREQRNDMMGLTEDKTKYPDVSVVYPYKVEDVSIQHTNIFTDDYMEYIDKIDGKIASYVGYTRMVGLNLMNRVDGVAQPVQTSAIKFSAYPTALKNPASNNKEVSYLESNFDLLEGEFPTNKSELVLIVDNKNRVQETVLEALGYDISSEEVKFEDIIGTPLKAILNNNFYVDTQLGVYTRNTDYEAMYENGNNLDLKIVGIIRQKEDVKISMLMDGIAYSDALAEYIIEDAMNSDIVIAQKDVDYNILTNEVVDKVAKDSVLSYLGGNVTPYMITIYPIDFESKDEVTKYLDEFNNQQANDEDKILYTDMGEMITSLSGGIMDGVTMVLIAFAATSLIVSLIMISIITYTSVLERTKEIGILKALGARKKDITRVFDAETFILGVFSGLLGIGIAYLLTFPINSVIYSATDLKNVAQLKLNYAVSLIAISTILTMLGGHIPAKMAAKKDAVEALRAE
ncbi:MAG: transporter ATP-binding/permease protein [Clostridiales bacterium]|jgi:putative ABC transport system permease protein|nr:transporter ATP-binding/permease protein [Clostridiales bacterium]